MAVTIKDVAKLAQVSPSTVSRVIANNPRISDATKRIVFDAMETLNYKPNAIARSLANRSTQTLGLILPSTDENLFKNPFFIEAMRGISLYAQKKGYRIMYTYSANPDEEVHFIEDFIQSKWVDGVVLLSAQENDKCIDFLKNADFPFVVVGRPESTNDILWVDNDNFQATYNVVNHLIEKGCTRIAFVGGPHSMNFSRDRLEGYRRAMEVRGLASADTHVVEMPDLTIDYGYEAMKILSERLELDAVVTTDDFLAIGANNYIGESGLDIKVVGFNNIPLGAYQTPSLTSVDIDAESLGYHAAKLLINRLKGIENSLNHFIVGTKLVERESTVVTK